MTFADLGLSPETLRAIEEVGYEHPTPIQEKAIPHVLMGRDVLGIAQTGTGKTAGFTLPMIEILANGRAKARMPRSLILAPTRELATQVSENFTTYGKYHKLDMALLIGGESMGDQMKALDKGVDVLIATPGRLLDLFERGKVLLRDVKVLVIDEADRMLDMGFIPDVERIVTLLPPLRQTLFFSATMDKEIRKLADAFLSNPREVSIERRATAAETVTQFLAMVPRIDKREALRHILRTENVRNAFIFCNRKRDVDVLNRSLKKHGFNCISLHGDMDQPTRNEMLRRFKDGEADLLVCSDVAARGLDIDDVSHVINFDIPTHSEDYVHRIGRTGRAGKDGAAFSLATPDDAKYVAGIESLLGRSIPRMPLEGLESIMTEDGEAERSNRRRREPRGDDRAVSRSDGRAASRSDDRRSRPKAAEDRSARGRRGGRGRGEDRDGVRAMSHADDVVAFGDHTPAFFMASTLVPMGSPMSGGADEDEETATAERARNGRRAKTRTRDARKPAPASRRGERKRHGRRDGRPDGEGEAASPDDAAVPEETASEETPQPSDAPEQASGGTSESDNTEAPPPRKRRATRRKKSEVAEGEGTEASAEAATAAEAEADAAPAKPKRTRRRKTAEPAADADATDSTPSETADGEAPKPKPKRTRRRTKATEAASGETGATDGADGAENAEPKPKPRHARSRKKTDAPKDEAAADPGEPPPDPAAEA